MATTNKLFNKNFVLLWQGQFVSKVGSQLFMMATVLWVTEMTGSAKILATIGAISAAISVVLGPFTGTFADQYSRKRIIVVTDFLNGMVIIAFAVVTFLRPDDVDLIVILLVTVSMVNAVLNSFFFPAIDAAVPDIVPKDKLAGANSMAQLAAQVSVIGGSGIGGFLFGLVGGPFLFLFNGVSYLFSSFSEMFITIPQKKLRKIENKHDAIVEFKKNFIQGFRYIWRRGGLKHVVLLYSLLAFFTQPIIILIPFFVKLFLDTGANWQEWVGFLSAANGFGSMVGFFLANFIKAKGSKRSTLIIISTLFEAIAFGVFGFMRNPFAALVVAFIAGIFAGFVMVNMIVILQVTTPSEIRGRLFGVLGTLNGALAPIAIALAGVIADALDKNIPVIYYFCSTAMFIVALVMTSFKSYRQFLEGTELENV